MSNLFSNCLSRNVIPHFLNTNNKDHVIKHELRLSTAHTLVLSIKTMMEDTIRSLIIALTRHHSSLPSPTPIQNWLVCAALKRMRKFNVLLIIYAICIKTSFRYGSEASDTQKVQIQVPIFMLILFGKSKNQGVLDS